MDYIHTIFIAVLESGLDFSKLHGWDCRICIS